MKHIAVGCDHVSISLKQAVVEYLRGRALEVVDFGANEPDIIVDYQDYAQKVALAVSTGEVDGGIVICGTGLGVSIAANKVPGVRTALCHDVYTAHQSRAHNDANVLALGAWIVSPQRMEGIVDEWLDTTFEGGRHIARINVLDRYMEKVKPDQKYNLQAFQFAIALSLRPTSFGPVLFSGRLEEGFSALSTAGFRHVEISIRNADDLPAGELKKLLEKYNLQTTALATGQGCIHDQLCFSTMDKDLHALAVQRFKSIIDLAANLNSRVIFGGVRGQLSGSSVERALQVEKVMESLHDCDCYAGERGVGLVLEPINRYETNFINSAAEGLEFLEKSGTKVTKILLDAFHMNIEEVDVASTLLQVGDRLGYFHIVDSNRQSPGQGHLDFKTIFATLNQIGYQGPVSAEILPLPSDESAIIRTRNFLAMLGASFG